MPAGETAAHRELKRLAMAWAGEVGFDIVASEVRVPRSGFRADVAAYHYSVTSLGKSLPQHLSPIR